MNAYLARVLAEQTAMANVRQADEAFLQAVEQKRAFSLIRKEAA